MLRKMNKTKLLFLIFAMSSIAILAAEDPYGNVALEYDRPTDQVTLSEVPIDIDVSNDWMHIIVNEEVENMSIGIYGPSSSAEYDIDYAMPGEIYEYDISDCPCGHYYITVDADGKTYNGNIQL